MGGASSRRILQLQGFFQAPESAMPTFGRTEPFEGDGEDWPSYVESLKAFFSANDVADDKKNTIFSVVATRRLTPYCEMWLSPPSDKMSP